MESFLGIDVGTGSVRAGFFDRGGRLLGAARRDIRIWHGDGAIVEQSTTDIWQALCSAVRDARRLAGLAPDDIVGIGVDATCSMAVIDEAGRPLPVSRSGDPERNVIVWMDHRATEQARRITASGHSVLSFVGGEMSPEMQTPKLLWLRENLPETFAAAGQFFDLADFLTWRMTGSLARSACTVTCKWTYLAHEARWDRSYFELIGLGILADEAFRRLGTVIVPPGSRMGGLTSGAAAEMGLAEDTAVGAALIDAHAGGLATVGGNSGDAGRIRMAYVAGTSACAMVTTDRQIFVPGVWGPYYDAMLPGRWLNEAGQSGAGAAIDRLLRMHPAAAEATARAKDENLPLAAWLERRVSSGMSDLSDVVLRANGLHVVPDFLGNRSPFADPDATAVIAGLGAGADIDDLVDLYVAGLCGLGYGLRQILETLAARGIAVDDIVVSGGLGASPLFGQLMADCSGLPVLRPESEEPVLLGAAMLGAVASGRLPSLSAVMSEMSRAQETWRPAAGAIAKWHAAKMAAFAALQKTEREIRRTMAAVSS